MIRAGLIFSFIALIAVTAISVYGWTAIPADMMIARHWDINGVANGFSPRNHILIGAPVMIVIFSTVFAAIPLIDPRPDNVKKSYGLLMAGWIGVLAIIVVTHAAIVVGAAKGITPEPAFTLYGVSLLLVVLGNYTAKSRSNFFLGVRTPWSLSSEHAWAAANRTGGWLFVLTGLAAGLATAVAGQPAGLRVLLAGGLTAAVVSIAVSYFAWRGDPERRGRVKH